MSGWRDNPLSFMASRARSARVRSTTLGCRQEGELALGAVKDRVEVLLDGKLLGISGRPTNGAAISLKIPQGKHRLDLLVEIMGRINYSKFMLEERMGLAASVLFAGKELGPFEQVSLPIQAPPTANYQEIQERKTLGSATFYRGKLTSGSPCDA